MTGSNAAGFSSDLLGLRLRWIPQATSASAILIGGLVVVGWWLEIPLLTSVSHRLVGMKFNTAVGFILTGASLWLLRAEPPGGRRRLAGQACGAIVALIGLFTLGEYLFGWDLGIDQLLFREREISAPYLMPGRMAPVTALNFLLLGNALLLLDVTTHDGYNLAPLLTIPVAMSGFVTLMAYLFGAESSSQAPPFSVVAVNTAFLFVALAIGVLFARSEHRFVRIVTSNTVAAGAMRRLLVVAILFPVFLGWLRLVGERLGFYGTEFGLALIIVFAVVGLTASVYWQATLLIRAEEFHRGINEMSAVLSRSLQLEEIYPSFAEGVRAILPYHRISVLVPEKESLAAVLSVAEPPLQAYQGKVWFKSANTAAEWVMAHKTPRLVRDLAQEQTFADEAFIAREGVRATLMLPLIAGGETVGVFVVDSRTPGAYSEGHEELIGLITEQLALAIQNARLYAQVARHAAELEQKVDERTQQLQEATCRAEAASRHKSAFLATMSHELRTPLNAILGFSELLREQIGGSLTAKQARYADHIHTSGQHLLTLINDLLDLSKVEAGKLTLRPEPFVLSEALSAALQEIRCMADAKQLTLTLDADTATAVLTADPVRFKQIVYNLLSNAVKFTPEGGGIAVTARFVSGAGQRETGSRKQAPGDRNLEPQHPDEFVEIAVTDTGIGIATDDLPKLFERFSQLETTKQSQGSGLGLVLTKQLVELHGGTIAVASAGQGRGSCFTVRLPLVPQVSPEP